METEKFFVRFIDSNETCVCSFDKLLDFVLNVGFYPMRIVPLDPNGNLVHELAFLVGDDYSLSFLFNDKNI